MEPDAIGGANGWNSKAAGCSYAAALVVINALICGRLFHIEYLDQLSSIEGAFIALARYIQRQHAWNAWFPLWHAGMPFSRVYQPLLHYLVAAVSTIFRTSPALSYHLVTAAAYAFGPVALYCLAASFSSNRPASFCAALIFSLFSPSLLFLGAMRVDAGGLWNPRRLQALVVYGEGPNILGLALCMIALASLHWAVRRKTAASALIAAFVLAAVPATNWPSTVALAMGLICYVAVLTAQQLRVSMPRISLVGLLACCLASPFALPSTTWSTFTNTNAISGSPASGWSRWASAVVLVAAIALLRKALLYFRMPLVLRFGILYSVLIGGIVLTDAWFGIRMLTQPWRFHLAMEIGLALSMVFAARTLSTHWPRTKMAAIIALALVCSVQFLNYRRYARQIIKPLQVRDTVEFQTANWFDRNMHGEAVMAMGTNSLWMNVFTNVPQLLGCCEQSVINPEDRIADYVIAKGYASDEQSADISLLWLKAYAVGAIAIGGPHSREHYKDFRYPYRFEGRLPLVWQQGDDRIYRVPERVRGLARVVPLDAVVRDAPHNGIDVAELRNFVAALDNPALPILETNWEGPGNAVLRGFLAPDAVISVGMNFDRGWSASANGRPVQVSQDGIGFLVIKPDCSGNCVVRLNWDSGWQPRFAASIASLALAAAIAWWWRERKSATTTH